MNRLSNSSLETKYIGREIIHFTEISSTNSFLLDDYKGELREGLVVIADYQSKGRGRLNRNWLSEKDKSLLFSILLLPKRDIKTYPQLTMLSALAIATTIEDLSGLQPEIKWPNDVYLNQKKCSGVLSEIKGSDKRLSSNSDCYIVMGLGLNVNQSKND